MNNPIDLRTCVPGQKLRSKHGAILTYVGLSVMAHEQKWPHRVKYPNEAPFGKDSYGFRTHDGFVMANPNKRLESDHDIVEILPLES